MNRPNAETLTRFFELLDRDARELSPVCRWLILGPELSTAILADHARPPTLDDLVTLLRLLEREVPELLPLGYWLVDASDLAAEARAEFLLDQVLAAAPDSWEHPTKILERPWPDYDLLWRACVGRRKRARGRPRLRLLQVEAKLERTARIEAAARKRRQRRRKRRR